MPDINDWIEANVALTPYERADSGHQKRPRYKNTVRGIAHQMVRSGQLLRVDRSVFRLP